MTSATQIPNVYNGFQTKFSEDIYNSKYAWRDHLGKPVETWPATAYRVTEHVLGALGYTESDEEFKVILDLICKRKFIPGGRYLYAAGRSLHQVNNCLMLRAEDSREGWAELLHNSAMALQTGAGIGVDYGQIRPSGSPIKRTGGVATGPCALMEMVNEIGRGVIQGGARRSAIWAGLPWDHHDCEKFIRIKDWKSEWRELKDKDFSFPMPMEGTNISVMLNDEFFDAYHDFTHPKHNLAQSIYWLTLKRMLKTAEPGFSIDVRENAGETTRNAPVTGGTHVLTDVGYQRVSDIVGRTIGLWTGVRFANARFERTQVNAPIVKVNITGGRIIRCEPTHEFFVERYIGAGKGNRQLDYIERIAAQDLVSGDQLHVSLPQSEVSGSDTEAYELGYIYGDGSFTRHGGAEVTFCTEESKLAFAGFEGHSYVNPSDGRGYIRAYFSSDDRFKGRSKEIFPEDLYESPSEEGYSFVAGLFDADGNYDKSQRRIRLASNHPNFLRGVARLLEQYGILAGVCKNGHSTYGQKQCWQLVVMADYHDLFAEIIPTRRLKIEESHTGYRQSAIKVESIESDGFEDVFCADVKVPEHSFMAEGVIISNCTELCSYDDSDICNLGSINLSKIKDDVDFDTTVYYATLFLLAGSVYSDVPYSKVRQVRDKNRRLGLGLMGIHEWLLKNDCKYGPNDELGSWLESYSESTKYAAEWADQHGLSHPVKTRAIAPNGTIGILGETTTGIEPLFCVAYKRRYQSNNGRNFQYVVDPTAKRLVQEGVDPDSIEDAYTLSYDVERRVKMQAWMQKYVDHGISSTINLPYPIIESAERRQFGEMLLNYLPYVRGLTVYPNGSRGGQPLTPATYSEAIKQEGVVFEENQETCVGGICGV